MKQSSLQIPFLIYPGLDALPAADILLMSSAKNATRDAYAPYSRFRVGAAVRLSNGNIVSGSNQENASFPAGLCAERVVLSAVSSSFPGMAVTDLALTYVNESGQASHPISPCGICRQTLAEYEQRFGAAIRLILGGATGEVFVFNGATDLLPFAFSSWELHSH
jgi:cytidine deaminase